MTCNNNETLQRTQKQDSSKDMLMSQYVRKFRSKTTTGIQSGPDALNESSVALTVLTILGLAELKIHSV